MKSKGKHIQQMLIITIYKDGTSQLTMVPQSTPDNGISKMQELRDYLAGHPGRFRTRAICDALDFKDQSIPSLCLRRLADEGLVRRAGPK